MSYCRYSCLNNDCGPPRRAQRGVCRIGERVFRLVAAVGVVRCGGMRVECDLSVICM